MVSEQSTVLSECGVTLVWGHRSPYLRIMSCLLEIANWSCPFAMPPGVCWASSIHTTRLVAGIIAMVVTSRSLPNCCASSKIGAGCLLDFCVRDNAANALKQFSGKLQVMHHFNKAAGACIFFAHNLEMTLAFSVQSHEP